ncbi:uncharacterized protein ppk25 [Chironomus tepperi]|uniref:uncharacterized protein ppk25 n=1 Tax=Chironomus tepperi TaxID=113505 RepID=UPI00391F7128
MIFQDQHVSLHVYEDNPTVLSVDIVSYGEFDRPSFTICTSNYNTTTIIKTIVKKFFGLEPGDERYNESVKFIEQIKGTMYNTLNLLEPFEDIPGINDLNLMDMSYDLFKDYPTAGVQFTKVMTERGMCQSSTTHYKLQLPLKSTSPFVQVNASIDRGDKCTSLEVCRISVTPNNLDVEAINRIYINSFDEVMCGDDLDYVELAGSSIQERHVKIDDIIADPNIRDFKPKSRKCKFMDEKQNDGYYDLYTPNFCKMSCRIRRALRYCKCVPYFYPVRGVKFCNVSGLVCLSKTEWYDASKCECMKLCETTILTKLSSKDQATLADVGDFSLLYVSLHRHQHDVSPSIFLIFNVTNSTRFSQKINRYCSSSPSTWLNRNEINAYATICVILR